MFKKSKNRSASNKLKARSYPAKQNWQLFGIGASPQQTQKLGEKLAKDILKSQARKKAVVLALKGELGAGKTTFLQGFARGLGVKEKILSPTFIILRRFGLKNPRFKNFYHIDCYRIKKPEEILELGFREIISDPRNIVAIEWPERISKILPRNAILIRFQFINIKTRKIWIKSV